MSTEAQRRRVCVAIRTVFAAGVLLGIAMSCIAQQPTTQPTEPQWKRDIREWSVAFRGLFKPGTTGSNVSELTQWQLGKLVGRDARIAQLEAVVRDHRKSPFADDAALLLARAYYLYDNQPDKAIAALYQVIRDYPNGSWIAEDPIVLRDIAVLTLSYGEERMGKATQSADSGLLEYMQRVTSYTGYASKHPNRTQDEAKVCIAWIIMQTKSDKRYQEAEQLLRGVVADHKEAKRTRADMAAAKELKNELIRTVLPRTERDAQRLLIDLLEKSGRHEAARAAAGEYGKLFEGHPSVESVVRKTP